MSEQNDLLPNIKSKSSTARNNGRVNIEDADASEALSSLNESLSKLLSGVQEEASAQTENLPSLKQPAQEPVQKEPVQKEPEKPEEQINPFMRTRKPVPQLASAQAAAGLPSLKQPSTQNSIGGAGLPSLKPAQNPNQNADGFPSLKPTPATNQNADGFPSLKPAQNLNPNASGLPFPKPTPGFGAQADGLPSLKPPAGVAAVPELTPNDNNNETLNPLFKLEPNLKASHRMDISAQRRNTISISSDELEKHLSEERLNSVPNPNKTPVPGASYSVPQLEADSLNSFGKKRKSFVFGNDPSVMPMEDDPLNLMGDVDKATQASTPAKPMANDILGLFDGAPDPSLTMTPMPEHANQQQSATPMKPVAAQGADPSVLVPTLLDADLTKDDAAIKIDENNQIDRDIVDNVPVPVIPELNENEPESSNEEELFDINSIQRESNVVRPGSSNKEQQISTKKSKHLKIILIIAASILVLGGLGVAVAKYIYDAKNIPEENLSVIPVEEDVNVNWSLVSNDNLRSYQLFYQQAIKRLKQTDAPQEERHEIQGKVLIALTLAQTHYGNYFVDDLEMIDNSANTIAESCEDKWCIIGLWSWGLSQNKPEMAEKFEPRLPEDSEYQPLIKLIKASTAFSAWKPEGQTWTEHQIAAEKLLEIAPEDNSVSENWPLYSWIRATTLRRLGKFDEALKAFDKMAPGSEDSLNKPALLLVQNDIHLSLDQYENIKSHAESMIKSSLISSEERTQSERLRLLADSTSLEWDEFENQLDAFIHNKEIENAAFIGADVCMHMNRQEACIPEIQAELNLLPNDLRLRKTLIELMFEHEGYDVLIHPEKTMDKLTQEQIAKLIDDGIAIDSKDITFWKYKGYLEFSRNQYELANKAFDDVEHGEHLIWSGTFLRAIENWRNQPKSTKNDIREMLKNYSQSLNDISDALILCHVLLFVDDPKTAHEVIDKIYIQHPENTNVVNARFEVAIAENDRDTAKKIIRQLEARHGLQSIHRYKYAELINQLGDPNTALENMLAILETENTVPEYLFYTGQLFFIQKHYDAALPYFNQALEIDSTNPDFHFYKGRCLYETGKYEDALIEFNEANTQNDLDMQYNLWIGLSLSKMRQQNEALRAFTTVIDTWLTLPKEDRTPKSTADVANAFFYRAEVLKYQNRRKDAEKDYLKALDLSKDNILFTSGYSVYLYESGKYKDAIALIDKIESKVGAEQLESVLYFVRGLSYLKIEKRPAAVTNLERARDLGFADLKELNIVGLLDPAEIYERLGYLYRDLGKREAARESLNMYIEKSEHLSPASKREVLQELEKI